jgi:hypothetical protein
MATSDKVKPIARRIGGGQASEEAFQAASIYSVLRRK